MAFRASVWPLATLPARMSMSWNCSVVAAGAGQVLHVAGGQVQRLVEAVAGQVAGVEDGAGVQGHLVEGEGAVAGLEVAAGVDDDQGGVLGRGGEVSPLAASRPPLPTTICVVPIVARESPRRRWRRSPCRCPSASGSVLDQHGDVGAHGQRRPAADREVAGEDVAQVGRRGRADGVQRQRLAAGELPARMSMSWNCTLLLPVPDRYCTSMAGRNSGELKLLPVRSPALRMVPVLRSTWLRAKVLLLAWRWPPQLTTIRVGVLGRWR